MTVESAPDIIEVRTIEKITHHLFTVFDRLSQEVDRFGSTVVAIILELIAVSFSDAGSSSTRIDSPMTIIIVAQSFIEEEFLSISRDISDAISTKHLGVTQSR